MPVTGWLRRWKDGVAGNWFALLLAAFTIYGISTKLLFSARMALNADSVCTGLVSMELAKHGNLLLTGFHLTAQDTFLFTEIIPFQLIPQIATGFDPLALKLTGFYIYLLILLLGAFVVYVLTHSRDSALIFVALAANISEPGYLNMANPTSHQATIVFVLIMVLIGLQVLTAGRNTRLPASYGIQIAVLAVLAFLTVFSDTLALLWFVVPFSLIYLLLRKGKTARSDLAVCLLLAVSLIACVLKFVVIGDYVKFIGRADGSGSGFLARVPHLLGSLGVYLHGDLYTAFVDGQAGALGLLILLGFAALLLLSVRGLLAARNRKATVVYALVFTSGAIVVSACLLSSLASGLGAIRYLMFTVVSVFLVAAVSYASLGKTSRSLFALFLIAVLAALAFSAYQSLVSAPWQSNQAEYGLIDYLESHDLHEGYSTYWLGNTVTYLSGENVILRPIRETPGGLTPYYWNSCDRWYSAGTADTFLVLGDGYTIGDDGIQPDRLASLTGNQTPEDNGVFHIYRLASFKLDYRAYEPEPNIRKVLLQLANSTD